MFLLCVHGIDGKPMRCSELLRLAGRRYMAPSRYSQVFFSCSRDVLEASFCRLAWLNCPCANTISMPAHSSNAISRTFRESTLTHLARTLSRPCSSKRQIRKILNDKMMAVQPTRLPLFLAAFGVLLLIATVFHQINGVPESWRTSFANTKTVQTQTR